MMSPGWTNFIVISRLKLVVEISRHVNDLEEYEEKALDLLVEEESRLDDLYDAPVVENKRINELTMVDMAILFEAKKISRALKGIDCSKLFLYWLSCKELEYEIISEMDFCEKEWQEKTKGFIVLRMFEE